MLIGLAAGLVAALFYGAPAAMQAHASRRLPEGPWWEMAWAAVRDRLMVTVVALYCLGGLANYYAIQHLPLYLAQAAIAVELIFTALASAFFLHEWPSASEWTALVVVCLGLAMLALSAGGVGGNAATTGLVPGLLAGAVVLVLLGIALRRTQGTLGSIVLGAISGGAYAGLPIGARVLVAPWVRWQNAELVVALVIFGVVGFTLYSLALQRASVNTASAPLILMQTALPAIVGITLFDDGIRPGWTWAVVVGLLLSVAGTVAVASVAPPLEEAVEAEAEKVGR